MKNSRRLNSHGCIRETTSNIICYRFLHIVQQYPTWAGRNCFGSCRLWKTKQLWQSQSKHMTCNRIAHHKKRPRHNASGISACVGGGHVYCAWVVHDSQCAKLQYCTVLSFGIQCLALGDVVLLCGYCTVLLLMLCCIPSGLFCRLFQWVILQCFFGAHVPYSFQNFRVFG